MDKLNLSSFYLLLFCYKGQEMKSKHLDVVEYSLLESELSKIDKTITQISESISLMQNINEDLISKVNNRINEIDVLFNFITKVINRNIKIATIYDEDFPIKLKDINSYYVFYCGDLKLFDSGTSVIKNIDDNFDNDLFLMLLDRMNSINLPLLTVHGLKNEDVYSSYLIKRSGIIISMVCYDFEKVILEKQFLINSGCLLLLSLNPLNDTIDPIDLYEANLLVAKLSKYIFIFNSNLHKGIAWLSAVEIIKNQSESIFVLAQGVGNLKLLELGGNALFGHDLYTCENFSDVLKIQLIGQETCLNNTLQLSVFDMEEEHEY